MDLVIVESPAKAKTIEGFLGEGFEVKSSFGHIRDLKKKGIAIEIENGFKPNYDVMDDKKAILKELKRSAKKANTVWLATDEDREGEAISWHLYEVLGLNEDNTKRIVFHEITKSAIQNAISNPRFIDFNLVNAQQARRVLDRLVGFELSPVLWRKVKPSLSAGRVQSVTVRLIVERENEINNFKSESFYKVKAIFKVDDKTEVEAVLKSNLSTLDEASEVLKSCIKSEFKISNLVTKPSTKKPSAPFTTSTLQQEASRKLGFSVAQTMSVAQKLYESGKITYMRTDSVNLSETAISAAKNEIMKSFGTEYSHPRKYSSKAKGAQEAHEAIRPAYLNQNSVDGNRNETRLYDLIWKRTIASQMADAKLEKTTVDIEGSELNQVFIAQGEVMKFDGFMKVYMESSDESEGDSQSNKILPPLSINQQLELNTANATERFTHHPARYTEASLVKKLEQLGIGRPSTYAPTISTVQNRGYVVKEDREGDERKYSVLEISNNQIQKKEKTEITGAEKKKLFPTDIGIVVNNFLSENFEQIMDYNFTAKVEKDFDEIANGAIKWNAMIGSFYGGFHETVENTLENSNRATGERLLGVDPKTSKNVYARIGRFGPMVQIGEAEDEEKPKFASIRGKLSINTISLEEALDLFKLPKQLGEYEDKGVHVGIGRFGPYVRYEKMFVSIPKDKDPLALELDEAIQLIKNKKEADAKKVIKVFSENEEVQVLNGRYGPYIKFGKKNVRIPKDKKPEELTLDECLELAEKSKKK